jgi:hypothetical protein
MEEAAAAAAALLGRLRANEIASAVAPSVPEIEG